MPARRQPSSSLMSPSLKNKASQHQDPPNDMKLTAKTSNYFFAISFQKISIRSHSLYYPSSFYHWPPFSSLDQMPLTWHMRNDILAVNFRSRPGPARVIAHAHNDVRQLALQPRGRLIRSCVASLSRAKLNCR